LIISFAIIVVLTSVSSAGGFWGFEGKDKEIMINIFIAIGILYFVGSILKRAYDYTKKT
jgi:prenyltransferase beta subunit